ncbi:MAG: AAA family ATPase [Myxococcota bacterium]
MEHLQHFGLTRDPFSNEPDLRFYFESGSHHDAQRRVERGLRQRKGLTVLTGEGGMGKTLLSRRILEALEEEVFEATLLMMLPGAADATSILQRFARQIGCDEPALDRAELLGQIYEQLSIVREDGRHAVLIIDDAQIMAPAALAELGGLLSLEYEDKRLLSMLLVGSPDLDKLVESDAGMKPRVDVRVRLQPLDLVNAAAYVKHRLSSVQGPEGLVTEESMETLHKFGRGRPRLINTLADNALFETYLGGRLAIECMDVERAAGDLGIGPDPGTTFSPQHRSVPPPPTLILPPTQAEIPAAEEMFDAAPTPEPVSAPTAVAAQSFAEDEIDPSALSLSDSAAAMEFPEIPPMAETEAVLETPQTEVAAPLESVVMPTAAFLMDVEEEAPALPETELELTSEVPPVTEAASVSPTLDLDEGLEAALEDFDVPEQPEAASLSLAQPPAEDPFAEFEFTATPELELEMPVSPSQSDLISPEPESSLEPTTDASEGERPLPPVGEMQDAGADPLAEVPGTASETELPPILPPAVDLMAEAEAIESPSEELLDLGLSPVTTPAEAPVDLMDAAPMLEDLEPELEMNLEVADSEDDLDLETDFGVVEAAELTPLEVESQEEFADGLFVELLEE